MVTSVERLSVLVASVEGDMDAVKMKRHKVMKNLLAT